MKRIFKYPTGAVIPKGAVYLSTITQTQEEIYRPGMRGGRDWAACFFVWHYFLVDAGD